MLYAIISFDYSYTYNVIVVTELNITRIGITMVKQTENKKNPSKASITVWYTYLSLAVCIFYSYYM